MDAHRQKRTSHVSTESNIKVVDVNFTDSKFKCYVHIADCIGIRTL